MATDDQAAGDTGLFSYRAPDGSAPAPRRIDTGTARAVAYFAAAIAFVLALAGWWWWASRASWSVVDPGGAQADAARLPITPVRPVPADPR